jgi:hypothetical protein
MKLTMKKYNIGDEVVITRSGPVLIPSASTVTFDTFPMFDPMEVIDIKAGTKGVIVNVNHEDYSIDVNGTIIEMYCENIVKSELWNTPLYNAMREGK